MITFKQKGKFEYQLLCHTKSPLDISLLPNNTMSNNFDTVISSIQAMSEIMGKVFDDYIFNFVNGYQKCDTEDERYAFLKENVNKTLQFSTVFVSENNINYAEFADETQKANDSIFFDTEDILKIFKLSQSLKIYSIVLNTEAGVDLENQRAIWNKFITLLKADYLPSKLHKFLEILSINVKKNKIRDYSEKKAGDDEDNIDNLILETLNFILFEKLITHDYKRNPIPFFVGILNTNIKYGGKYKPDNSVVFDDDEVDKIDDKISRRGSTEKNRADKNILKQLYRISLFYLSSSYKSTHNSKISNQKYKKNLEKIEYTSPFWNTILAPALSKPIGIGCEKLREIPPKQAAVISFYSVIKLNFIFKKKYLNLFRLAYLFPINSPDFRFYRLKNVSQFINATLQFPVKDLSSIGGSRIYTLRLIEDFIGKIKSTPFCSICTGHVINNIQTEKLEIETIDYIVRYFTKDLEKEIKELKTAIVEDFDRYKDNKIIEKRNNFGGKIAKEKRIRFQINRRVPSSNLNESKIDEQYFFGTDQMRSQETTSATVFKKNILFHTAKSKALTPQNKIDQHNLPFTLNTSIGCLFRCRYCFVQGYPFNKHAIFGEEVKVKLWIAEQLDRDLKKYHGLPQHLKRVQVNVATEGYLPSAMIKVKKELGRDLMAEVLTVFRKHWQEGNQWMVHLITKSHMVQKHLDIISAMREQVQLEITITTLDESRRKQIECLAPSVKRRLEIIRKFADAGVFVRVMCMPLIGTRKDAEEISAVCFDHGAKAFKHKGVNYWDEKALLAGETVKDSGREDEVFDDLVLKSSELIFENGSPKKLIVKMPVIIRSGKSKRWQGYKKEDLREREMSIENSGYADINNINWGYVV